MGKHTDFAAQLVMHPDLSCAMAMEPTYYSSKLFDNTACYYCGVAGSPVSTTVVAKIIYPLCDRCRAKGLTDHVYGLKKRLATTGVDAATNGVIKRERTLNTNAMLAMLRDDGHGGVPKPSAPVQPRQQPKKGSVTSRGVAAQFFGFPRAKEAQDNTIDSDGWEVEQGEHGGDDSAMDDVDEDAELAAIMQESWHAKE